MCKMGGTGIRSNVEREFKLFLVFSRPLSIFPVDIRKCVILFMAETGRKKGIFWNYAAFYVSSKCKTLWAMTRRKMQ